MNIKEHITSKDRFSQHLGIDLTEVSEGEARAQLIIKEEHLNSVDIVHGGAIFSLADLTFAAASNSHGNVALAINASISFVKSAKKGSTMYAHAYESSLNHKLATYIVDITSKEGELIAQFTGMVYRKKDKIAE